MAPPVIMGIGAGISAVGSILGGQAAMAAGSYQQTIADRNAAMYRMKADDAYSIGQINIQKFNNAFNKAESETKSKYIASGVKIDSGTPIEVQLYNLQQAELERLNISYDASVDSYNYKEQAVQSEMQGRLAMYQARSQRASSFLNATGTMVGYYGSTSLINQQAKNQKIITDKMIKNQKSLITSTNTLNKNIVDLQIKHSNLLADQGFN
jgi:hypothetical protein